VREKTDIKPTSVIRQTRRRNVRFQGTNKPFMPTIPSGNVRLGAGHPLARAHRAKLENGFFVRVAESVSPNSRLALRARIASGAARSVNGRSVSQRSDAFFENQISPRNERARAKPKAKRV